MGYGKNCVRKSMVQQWMWKLKLKVQRKFKGQRKNYKKYIVHQLPCALENKSSHTYAKQFCFENHVYLDSQT